MRRNEVNSMVKKTYTKKEIAKDEQSNKAEMVLLSIMKHLYQNGDLEKAANIGALIEELRDENDSKIAKRSRT